MKIKNLPVAERPVEKTLSKGIHHLSNSELVAVLIGTGTRDKSAIGLAEEIISKDERGIMYLAETTADDLLKISGVGKSKAVRVLAAVELGKRIAVSPKSKYLEIKNPEDIASLFIEEMRYEKREFFKALLLSAKAEIISIETISIGDLTHTTVNPRDAFVPAVKKSASAVIFVHNHPSGDPTPSREDIDATNRLVEAGEVLGIKVLDHVIVGDGKFVSINEYLKI